MKSKNQKNYIFSPSASSYDITEPFYKLAVAEPSHRKPYLQLAIKTGFLPAIPHTHLRGFCPKINFAQHPRNKKNAAPARCHVALAWGNIRAKTTGDQTKVKEV